MVVVVNFANRGYDRYTHRLAPGGPLAGAVQQRLGRLQRTTSATTPVSTPMADDEPRDGMPHSGDVGIGRYTAIILSQDAI